MSSVSSATRPSEIGGRSAETAASPCRTAYICSPDRSATAALVQRLPDHLVRRGFRWLVFTGTPHVRALVAGFGAPLVDLGPADATRLQGDAGQWGRYYEETPRVMAGWLGHCARVAA